MARAREQGTELSTRYKAMLDETERLLLRELDVTEASSRQLASLRARAENIRDLSGDFRLNAFVTRIAKFEGTQADVEGSASY
jgi:hypothetical protein